MHDRFEERIFHVPVGKKIKNIYRMETEVIKAPHENGHFEVKKVEEDNGQWTAVFHRKIKRKDQKDHRKLCSLYFDRKKTW